MTEVDEIGDEPKKLLDDDLVILCFEPSQPHRATG